MKKITVPFRRHHIMMSVTEAEQFAIDLAKALERVKESDSDTAPPQTDDGFITKDAMYAFFADIYPDAAMLRNHAGRLFMKLVRAHSWYGVPFRIVCAYCGRDMKEECDERIRHQPYEKLKIEVSSLKEHADKIISGRTRVKSAGPAIIEDLKILLARL